MNSISEIVSNQNELSALCEKVVNTFPNATIFTLQGDLGAGKTTFVKSFCNFLHVHDDVSSPTFSIVNEYQSDTETVYHMDLYRIEEPEELIGIGFEEYFDNNAYFFIEWPEIAEGILPPHIRITIEILSETARKFNFVRMDQL